MISLIVPCNKNKKRNEKRRKHDRDDRDDHKQNTSPHFRIRHTFSPFTLLLMEGLRNHNFIIPRPMQKNKREMPGNQGKTPAFPLTSCPESAGQGGDGLIADADRDHSALRRLSAACYFVPSSSSKWKKLICRRPLNMESSEPVFSIRNL